jgi:hypothetical protein
MGFILGYLPYEKNQKNQRNCLHLQPFLFKLYNTHLASVAQVIPFEEWQDEYFPTNCWGVVYIMSSEVRDNLIKVSYVSES